MRLLKIIVLSLVGFCGIALGDWGTGSFISEDGYILTDAHVVTDDGVNTIPTYAVIDGKYVFARLISMYPQSDLALLKVQGNNYPCLQRSSNDVIFGLSYTLIQYNHYTGIPPYRFILTSPYVTIVRSMNTASDAKWLPPHLMNFFYSKTTRPGNSGSAIVDYSGKIVGLLETGDSKVTMGAISNILINRFVPSYVTCRYQSNTLINTAVILYHG